MNDTAQAVHLYYKIAPVVPNGTNGPAYIEGKAV
jgi:hypothetical protein